EAWEHYTLEMSRQSVAAVLGDVERNRVGSYVFVSCTGDAGPTPEMLLSKEFELPRGLSRAFVGPMCCPGAVDGPQGALDAAAARPDELALVTCAEVCSVHLRPEATKEQVVVTGLFGDAAATILLCATDAGVPETDTPIILGTHTETHGETSHAMTWKV